jgi:hypothetical protein
MSKKYEISLDKGNSWKPITLTELKKRLSRITEYETAEMININKGKIFNGSGYGWFRRKSGKWNSPKLKDSTYKNIARVMVYRLSHEHIEFPISVTDKEKALILKHMKEYCDKRLDTIDENKLKEASDYLNKAMEYSPCIQVIK